MSVPEIENPVALLTFMSPIYKSTLFSSKLNVAAEINTGPLGFVPKVVTC